MSVCQNFIKKFLIKKTRTTAIAALIKFSGEVFVVYQTLIIKFGFVLLAFAALVVFSNFLLEILDHVLWPRSSCRNQITGEGFAELLVKKRRFVTRMAGSISSISRSQIEVPGRLD